jgi:Luciferase-like monooxygenase
MAIRRALGVTFSFALFPIQQKLAMKFGIFIFGDNHPELGRSNQKYYQEVLTRDEWAEELGFDSFWLGEHHLYWYGTCVSPPMIIAALGQRTKRIRLGPAMAGVPMGDAWRTLELMSKEVLPKFK